MGKATGVAMTSAGLGGDGMGWQQAAGSWRICALPSSYSPHLGGAVDARALERDNGAGVLLQQRRHGPQLGALLVLARPCVVADHALWAAAVCGREE